MRKASVAHSALATAAMAHAMHSSCTASIAAEKVGLQLSQIAVNCNAAEKALLADVTEAHPDASHVELLRLFKVRRSVPDAHSQRACCVVSAHS
jgi:hypothetical protein